ncbi:hypothetical protein AUJ68_02165 [Candidatus Woesearchaeota archaeon CG1_02_57_44]|nr:MAG: hypothetical protein AUJ68_02165 [Candidatus Woesearchaeota archaeon CG1_02_57_44]
MCSAGSERAQDARRDARRQGSPTGSGQTEWNDMNPNDIEMKRAGNAFIALLLFVTLLAFTATPVLATASLTYHFQDANAAPVHNVYTEIYTCTNSDCSQVTSTFRRSLFSGPADTATINYPTQLQSQYGYAVYQMASCVIPKAGVATWAGNGQQDWQYTFEQVPVCKSDILDATVSAQSVDVGTPVQLSVQYKSAFKQTLLRPRYIPSGYASYFSSDLTASVTITRSGQTTPVYTQSKSESLLMDAQSSASWTFTPQQEGTYTIRFTTDVSDCQCAGSQVQERTFTLDVARPTQPPVAVIAGTPARGDAPLSVAFSSTGSYDPDGTIASYAWTFGDSATSTASAPSHTFATPGDYTVSLVVTDNDGLQSQPATVRIEVLEPLGLLGDQTDGTIFTRWT